MQLTRNILLVLTGAIAGCRAAETPLPDMGAIPRVTTDSDLSSTLATRKLDARQVTYEEPAQPEKEDAAPLLRNAELPNLGSVTLSRLEQIALAQNPVLAQSMARIDALRGKQLQSGLPPNVMIGYAAEEIGDEGTAGKQGGYLSQQFIRGGKLQLNRAVAGQEIVRAEQQFAAQRQRVLTDVRIGYYDALIAQRRLGLARDLVDASDAAVNSSRELVQAQEIPLMGLLQTEVEAQNARIQLRMAGNERDAAWRRLAAVMGTPDLQPLPLEGTIDADAIQLEWHEELARLLRDSPQASEAVAELEQAYRSLDRAYAQVTPDVNLQLTVQHDNATDTVVSGVQAVFPVPIWNRNQGGIQQARSEIVAAERNIERVQLSLTQRLADAFRSYSDARFQVQTFTGEILPKAKQNFDLVSEGYRRGELGYLDMLTAQRTYFQTNLSSMDALRNLWQARLQIEGLLLNNSLAFEIGTD